MPKVFLGNFSYAEFTPGHIKITDEDGTGRVLDVVILDAAQWHRLLVAAHQHGRID